MNRLFDSPPEWQSVILAVLAAAAIALVIAEAGARLLRSFIRHFLGDDGHAGMRNPLVRGPIRLVRLTLFVVLLIALTPPALEFFGQRPRKGLHLGDVTTWLLGGGLRVLLIATIAFVLVRVGQLLVRRFEQDVSVGTGLEVLERAKRAKTLGGLVQNVLTTLVVIVATMMILREVGLDITPILTGAGILGLAVGFGAQTLVKDIISGFFLILENDVRIGDFVDIGAHSGIVEEMNLRTIVLRDAEGTVHVIPNGSIAALSNRSKDHAYYVIDVPAAYRTDTDEVVRILEEAGASLRADDHLAPFILDDLEVLGVDAFTDTAVNVKARIKTVPLKQWVVGRELRRRLKRALDEAGVELAHRPEPETKA